ncbi:hypothetical protein [Ruegeria atlantica]|nr:hypothetical protein [Ruegeria atlantica]
MDSVALCFAAALAVAAMAVPFVLEEPEPVSLDVYIAKSEEHFSR